MTDPVRVPLSCPYPLCGAVVQVTGTGPTPDHADLNAQFWKLLIPQHTLDHPRLNGPCPASLMYFPIMFGSREAEILRERHEWDLRRLMILFDHDGEDPSAESNVSQSLRGPHRIGREPPPRSKDWHLKGRADEDIQPDAVLHPNAEGIYGRVMGKMSLQDVLGALNGAAIKLGEGRASTADALDQLHGAQVAFVEARDMVIAAKGNVTSDTLDTYIAWCQGAINNITDAIANLERVDGSAAGAIEKGEEFSGRVHG